MRSVANLGGRLASASLLLASGCFWTSFEDVSDVMWSDDDEMFAIVVARVDIATHTLDEGGSDQKSRRFRPRRQHAALTPIRALPWRPRRQHAVLSPISTPR